MSVDATGIGPGTRLGPYQIERRLGAGGMGQVFRARDTRLGRTVAIKVSLKQFSGRFEREAHAIAAMNHSHICTLYDVGPNYLVMELVEGETLARALKRGPLPLDQALRYAAQIAEALAAAHAQGIIHRDLKPANIDDAAGRAVKVLDFGLAKHAVEARRAHGNSGVHRSGRADGGRADDRHRRLHVAGAGRGKAPRRALRRVCVRRGPVRDVVRPTSVPG